MIQLLALHSYSRIVYTNFFKVDCKNNFLQLIFSICLLVLSFIFTTMFTLLPVLLNIYDIVDSNIEIKFGILRGTLLKINLIIPQNLTIDGIHCQEGMKEPDLCS